MDSSSAFEVRRVSGEREAGDRERFHATEPKAVSSSAASTECFFVSASWMHWR